MALYKRRVRALTVFVIIAVFVGLPCIIILSQNPALLRFQYEVSRGFQFLLGKEVEGHRREPPWRETLKQDEEELPGLEDILARASMPDKTVILTTLNAAWAQPNTMIDLFLDSFHQGEGIEYLLNHLVIIALDQVAYNRCTELHTACFMLTTEGVDFAAEKFFMTGEYLMMMWRRIQFLRKVLEMGYSFVFSDTDIMWFRDPFPRFDKSADLQIACDKYIGIPEDLDNQPNGGFVYARSNNRTIDFYKYWYMSREDHPGLHDQDVLNEIKFDQDFVDIGLELRFLNTLYFGGFCEVSKDLEQVCTMHANCCTGLQRKLKDLRLVKEDWKCFRQMSPQMKKLQRVYWRAPRQCLLSFEV
ncbi:unnamed protein product [Sphagnum troendelagicum]|uniref:Nucleotide-diphospho-sugar transferase domain-containing protein n=1 Tax=Sphagnum troendelagicum TaxID=128251 RepID=A0ABP0U2W5_9BRYO